MADAGDHGNGAGGDGAGEGFVVEAVKIFPASAAASDEDDVGAIGVCAEPTDAGGDLASGVGALHGGGVDQQVYRGVAAATDLYDVTERRSLQACNDADAAREGRQRAGVGEDAFAAQAVFEGLDCG